MSQTLKETYAEIEAEAHRVSWILMDEDQRDEFMEKVVVPRWGKTTSDGVTLKATAWARMIGATVDSIDGRFRRLRRSEGQDGPSRSKDALEPNSRSERAIRTIRRQPELANQLVRDPATRKAVERALSEQYDAEVAGRRPSQPRDDGDRFTQAVIAIRNARRKLKEFAELTAGGGWTDDEMEALTAQLDAVVSASQLIRSGIGSGSMDEALADLLDAEAGS